MTTDEKNPPPERAAGVLLHPTSLPSPWGIGDLGPTAHGFVEWIAGAGLSVWQVLPSGPTGPQGSPYDSPSAFAGNPLLISPQLLHSMNLLRDEDLLEVPIDGVDPDCVDYGVAALWKNRLLRRSWTRFRNGGFPRLERDLEEFRDSPAQKSWLNDWCLFRSVKQRERDRSWVDWTPGLAHRDARTLEKTRRDLEHEIAFQAFVQFLFQKQWNELHARARDLGVRIVGDVPIYVAHDSADVWANQEIFDLLGNGHPRVVAGVPPDYFSEDGQRWGNPLYRWNVIAQQGYRWWVERLRVNVSRADLVRLDHFRGFAAYWEIAASAETAREGHWKPGPGQALFEAARTALGSLPFIAEDLGTITPDVDTLRNELGFPGMRVAQFGFGDRESIHHPRQYSSDVVAYTGTHDNETTRSWFDHLPSGEQAFVLETTGGSKTSVVWDLISLVFQSEAGISIAPLQDLLELDASARMNRPGKTDGNWRWRVMPDSLDDDLASRVRDLVSETRRECDNRSSIR